MLAWYCVRFFLWVLDGRGDMVAIESTGEQTRELGKTPTWAVAGVSAVMIIISVVLEKVLEKVGEIRGWKGEKETSSSDYEFSNDFFFLMMFGSSVLCGPFVVYLLLNVKGWQALFWAYPLLVIVRNFVRKRIPGRGCGRLCLVLLLLLFLLAQSAGGEHSGGEHGDGGSAGDKGGVSGGPPGGDTDVGSAPSPPMLRR